MENHIIDQVRKNFDAYVNEYREQMERTHLGKTLLMHNEKIIDAFEDREMAYLRGYEEFGLGQFTLIAVGDKPVQLGVMSMALT